MRSSSFSIFTASAVFVAAFAVSVGAQRQRPQAPQPAPTKAPAVTNPDTDPRAEVAKRVCATCHPFEIVVAIRRTRAQWEATVETMIGRGARATPAEFATIIDYLSEAYGLSASPVRGAAGPDDKPLVDPKAVEQAKPVFASTCASCHGADARGTPKGSNLIRSLVVLHDRYGSVLGPYLRKDHPPAATLKPAEITDHTVLLLAHFLRDRVNDTLRGSPNFHPGNIVSGDPAAGAAYFNGEGGCAKCHSPTGDLAGIATRMDPVAVQQRFLFPFNAIGGGRRGAGGPPRPAAVVTVSVTPEGGQTVSGELVRMDDFTVTLRDSAHNYRTFTRTPGTKVVKNDPLAAHAELLTRITDKNIHDVVAYLETLK
jgi:mono/diheme cytochrome c family protein